MACAAITLRALPCARFFQNAKGFRVHIQKSPANALLDGRNVQRPQSPQVFRVEIFQGSFNCVPGTRYSIPEIRA